MEAMLVKRYFRTEHREFIPGELFMSSEKMKRLLLYEMVKNNVPKSLVEFIPLHSIFKKLHKDSNVKDMVIIRYGGIGDLIALTSIIDYFNVRTHFVTQKKYFPIFEWFEVKPKLYATNEYLFNNFNKRDSFIKMSNWYRFEVEGVIENGHRKNWYELFFEMIGENDPGEQFYRPALRTDRINNNPSNISKLATGKKSILICNKATAMMRTCKASDIINSLSAEVKEEFSIFVYESNLEKNENITGATIIGKSSFDTFLLDLYDADLVISVDTGAIHFREGIQKMAIGLYNSFTVDSRTKYYQFTSSFDIKSNCELQPCFKHERPFDTFCQKGNETMFAAPCFDSKYNKTLIKQLSEIFKII